MEKETFDQSKEPVSCPYVLILYESKDKDIYVYIYNALGGRFFGIGGSREYAYKFLDYKQIGYLSVIKWILVFTIAIFVLSNILVFLDRRKNTSS